MTEKRTILEGKLHERDASEIQECLRFGVPWNGWIITSLRVKEDHQWYIDAVVEGYRA